MPLQSLEQQRAEALAVYGATLLAPVLAELETIRQENRDQAETIGTLRAQLAAAAKLASRDANSAEAETTSRDVVSPPRPWWARWLWWQRP
jgi:hypothetical protein